MSDHDDFEPATKTLLKQLQKIGDELERIGDSLDVVAEHMITAMWEKGSPDGQDRKDHDTQG